MVAFNKLNGFVEHMAEGVHNLGSDQIAVALSNTAPGSESTDPSVLTADCILANVTEIDYSDVSSRAVTTTSSEQSSGTYKLTLTDLILSFSGTIPAFRYVYVYNDTPTSPADPLIAYYDYGSSLEFFNGEQLTINFDDSNGAFTLS